ncbi:helix-turn-helix domain-containing protein [Microbacterium sp. KUDC0406]|uniref:winged helix-turn-helix domain-containing protein n=1 Tax=Microbacterium sp. KUDC0406 TaxID=2909588 RepID=UPI001F1A24A2|nr:helix-turn-helix domain-containing protein [Microbacterium sp. KUDC0406]UJP11213.1 helix-turn-helix domain-containing protein [Microbacterium sp. KUDC0406]
MEEISVITAISHPLRRRIIDRLLLHGPTQVGTFARTLDAQVGSISHHLRMLQKAGVIEQVEDPDGDRRTSWWQLTRRSFSWSSEDYESPADALLAREAQRANVRNQLDRLQRWYRVSPSSEWTGFNTDTLGWATQDELLDLQARLAGMLDDWRSGIDRDDGQERRPVYFFAHGFPTEV